MAKSFSWWTLLLTCTNTLALGAALPDGAALMEQVYGQGADRNVQVDGRLTVYPAHGPAQTKSFRYRRRAGAPMRERLDLTAPPELAGVSLLSVHSGARAQQYIYIPATGRARPIADTQRSAQFLGSDFSFEDIEAAIAQAFTYRTIGDGEAIDARPTVEIEALPREPSASQYARKLLWVARDVPVLLRERLFAADGSLVRERNNHQIHHDDGVWGTRQSEMRTSKDGTRSVLTVDRVSFPLTLPDEAFTPEALERDGTPAGTAP